MKKKIVGLIVALIIEISMVLSICGLSGLFTEQLEPQDIVRYVCDGFFAAGMLNVCIGGLLWVSKQGTFDGLGYTVSRWKDSIMKNRRDWHKEQDYYDYQQKQAEKKKQKSVNEMFVVGGASLVIAIVLFIVYKFAF